MVPLISLSLTGCISTYVPPAEPGFYGVTSRWGYNDDIEGKVGYQLAVSGPRARCEPDRNWSANLSITTGVLPPGLSMDSSGAITGIPTQRGNWIVTMHMGPVTCGGSTYNDAAFDQQLRFHIGGTGEVVQ